MPCNSDYMEPNYKEKALQQTAQLLIYVLNHKLVNTKPGPALESATKDIYCRQDYVEKLCNVLSNFSDYELDQIVYDGRNATARKLADWWYKHKYADELRIEKEKVAKIIDEIKKIALSKLTSEEKKMLGL
jgi:hypothetical protein